MTDKIILARGRNTAEELGLRDNLGWYPQDTIHRLLGLGVEVRGGGHYTSPRCVESIRTWSPKSLFDAESDTHTAFLIGIRPLAVESEERKLLREFVACCKVDDPKLRWGELYHRARALLEKP